MTDALLTEIEVDGDRSIINARYRLEYVRVIIDGRHDAVAREKATRWPGPAFTVHLRGLPALLADPPCRADLENLCLHGERDGVVALVYGDPDEAAAAVHEASEKVLAAMLAGVVMRMAPTREPPQRWHMTSMETAADARLYTEALSAELWAALALPDYDMLIRIIKYLRDSGERAAGPTERYLVADALRRCADILLPGAGGMLPFVGCPLCLATPMMRADEMPGHLLAVHGNLAEGMRR
jgi:hypothetical protein